MAPRNLSYYFDRYAQGKLTAPERGEFATLLQDPANRQAVQEILDRDWPLWEKAQLDFPEALARIEAGVAAALAAERRESAIPVHRVHFLRQARWWAAAAVIVIVSTILVFYFSNPEVLQIVKTPKNTPTDIQPGGNKAVLTLADGTTIILDSAANGSIAKQGSTDIVKTTNGQIIYKGHGQPISKTMLNTMSTPRGGQYQLTLPDGTKVRLNAASSITYPARFAGNTRPIKISGEAYLEVARDQSKPFIVDVDSKSKVEVLGTHFNINAYEDEGAIRTTLIEGSVKVNGVVIAPGQQARQTGSGISVINNADIDQVLAWKNGLFKFNRADIETVMRQISRWYDVEVSYPNGIPGEYYWGAIRRDQSLSSVFKVLEESGAHFKIEGKKVIVLP